MIRVRTTLLVFALAACAPETPTAPTPLAIDPPAMPSDPEARYAPDEFVMGVDLSYVNQILDHGGVYRDSGRVKDPYALFADRGANVVRLRLWHTPSWVRDSIYGAAAPLYSGLDDVTEAIRRAKAAGMQVNLDFHYSDIWADPGRQNPPAAWLHVRDLETLADSVHAYTRGVLAHLGARGLSPEFVQVGNETNCGMLATGTPAGFPNVRTCDGNWAAQGAVLNAGIRAVRETAPDARVILHVAQPENVARFFRGITSDSGGVSDFDVIGFSYYELWSDANLAQVSDYIAAWRQEFGRDVMIVETAYPWTLGNADGYGNILGAAAVSAAYPATVAGQRAYMMALTEEVVSGGGSGIMYWEPAWITSGMRDLWGTGSSWDNATLFDAHGNALAGIDWMTRAYDGLRERATERRRGDGFAVGADLSFLKAAEDRGVAFRDGGVARPALDIFRDHGYDWIRLRLFHTPHTLPNSLDYTIALARDAKARGYRFLLDYHYADHWADPQQQPTPAAWDTTDIDVLADSVFAYTRATIEAFRAAGVMPDMVQLGNEVRNGMMWPLGRLPENWDNFARLFEAGRRGIEAGRGDAPMPLVMLHYDNGADTEGVRYFYDRFDEYGIDYDVIGLSYYPWWHGTLIELRDNLIATLEHHPAHDVMLVEVGYRPGVYEWEERLPPYADDAPGGSRAAFLESVADVVLGIDSRRITGIFWWEPATRCPSDFFDAQCDARPVIEVFDHWKRQ